MAGRFRHSIPRGMRKRGGGGEFSPCLLLVHYANDGMDERNDEVADYLMRLRARSRLAYSHREAEEFLFSLLFFFFLLFFFKTPFS